MPGYRRTNHFLRTFLLLVVGAAFSLTLSIKSGSAQIVENSGEGKLKLRAAEFDPTRGLPSQSLPMPAPRTEHALDSPRLWIIQFDGPIVDSDLAAATDAGLTVISYIPDYAYLVWGDLTMLSQALQRARLRWWGEYLPGYALHPELAQRAAAEPDEADPGKPADRVDVEVQLVDQPGMAAVTTDILQASERVITPPYSFLAYRNLAVSIRVDRLDWLASQPGVVNVEPRLEMVRLDERQGQIIAGNLAGGGAYPSGPGYLDWLLEQGFINDPERYPIIDITDDGIDDGDDQPTHPDFYLSGDILLTDRLVYNANLTLDQFADGAGGHGTLNASVAGGYNHNSGLIERDPNGYQRGLGINPFGRIAGTKVFRNSGFWGLVGTYAGLIENSYTLGARISSNSWGANTAGAYTYTDQAYDAFVRDADGSSPGSQSMVIIFAAGNDGPLSNTIGSPGNAKNVITVGASETYRPVLEPFGFNGCDVGAADADQPEQIANFSSRGPADDLRTKPDLVAPGTMILGAASQIPGYNGSGVCIQFYPAGQTLYAASSGTSHSTPAVSGAASLLDPYYRERFGGAAPSPAMVKAYLVNSARYLNSQGESLPSNHQGFGRVDLGRAFDEVPRWLSDQGTIFGATGEIYEASGVIFSSQHELRITLAWTDAPGTPISSAAYVNNLDLELEFGGNVYRGNVFSGRFSQPGGSPDVRNNVESIIIPAGLSGPFTVRVRATNIAGDGVPGNSDPTDQDFALVVYNAASLGGLVRGQVTSVPDGSPLPGALVWAVSAEDDLVQTETDENGNYELALNAGTYTINAWTPAYLQSEAGGIIVANNAVILNDFALITANEFWLSGCVTDQATGAGLAADVTVAGPLDTLMDAAATTRSDPCYELQIPAGRYIVEAAARLHLNSSVDVNIDRDTEVNLSLAATTLDGLLTGRVVDDWNGNPIPGAIVTDVETGESVETDADGGYELLLPAGSQAVTASANYRQDETAVILIPQSNIEEFNFELRSARLDVGPPMSQIYSITPADTIDVAIRIENIGTGPLHFDIYERESLQTPGGQDDAGYTWMDNRSGGDVRFEWPTPTGETILQDLTDDGGADIDLPFPFNFYGESYDVLRVSNNGAASFNPAYGNLPYENPRLASIAQPILAPYWDDLSVSHGRVTYWVTGSAPERKFYVAWLQRPHYSYTTGYISFAMALHETTGNIEFLYADVSFGSTVYDSGRSATIGIHSGKTAYLEYAYNQAALVNDRAICFQPPGAPPCSRIDLPWLDASPMAGTLDPGEQTMLTAMLRARPGTRYGTLNGGLQIYANDPYRLPFVDIPIEVYHEPPPIYLPLVRR